MKHARLSGLIAAFSLASCATPQQPFEASSPQENPSAPSVPAASIDVASQSAVFIPQVEPKTLLANEPIDSAWSDDVERRLANELKGRLSDSFIPEIECRSTMCGVGFRLERGWHIKGELGIELAESIGLAQSHAY